MMAFPYRCWRPLRGDCGLPAGKAMPPAITYGVAGAPMKLDMPFIARSPACHFVDCRPAEIATVSTAEADAMRELSQCLMIEADASLAMPLTSRREFSIIS